MTHDISQKNMKLDIGENFFSLNNDKEISKGNIVKIDIEKIYPNENQPRKRFDNENIDSLCNSIKKHGILQPIVVKKTIKGII